MRKFLALSSLLGIALTACSGSNTGIIKIGYIGPLTGDIAAIGADTMNGAKLAIDEVNTKGGIDGRLVELIAEDGKCSGSDAATAAQKLVSVDKVSGIFGGQCSSETLAAAPIAEAAQIVLISPVSSSPDVTLAGEFVFRPYPSDDLKGKAMANYFSKRGFTKVAVISENTDFCQGILTSVQKYLPAGIEIVFDEKVEPGTKDYRTLLTRLQDIDFDVFIVNSQSETTGSVMLAQMRELGLTQQALGADVLDTPKMAELAGEAAEKLHVISVPSMEETSPFSQKFIAAYGKPQFGLVYAAHAYDAASVLLKALTESETPAGARDVLATMPPYQGATGTFSFDENGDVIGIPYVLKEFQGSSIVKLEDIPLN